MCAEIRIDVGFHSHRKTKRLIAMLGLQGPWSLQILWAKMSTQRTKGVLTGMDETDIALEAEWPGDAQEFVAALMTCGGVGKPGYLEKGDDGVYRLHGWEDHQRYVLFAEERVEQARMAAKARWEKR